MTDSFAQAERRLFERYGVAFEPRSLRLADPDLEIGVRECGEGSPVLFVHGSAMSGATWAPLLAALPDRRAIAIDLPGFGRSDPYSYTGRSLRAHAQAQLVSTLDALGLGRVPVVGTSLGAMWAFCLALHAPERVTALVGLGMPAVALPGMRSDPFFRLMTTPGVGRVVARMPAPPNVGMTRRTALGVMGRRALRQTPDEFFEVMRCGMAAPGWGEAMWTHLNLALRAGRQRPENVLTDAELGEIACPVRLIWGDEDPYGGPEIGRRAAGLMRDAELVVVEGGHAPFLDDPVRCAEVIRSVT